MPTLPSLQPRCYDIVRITGITGITGITTEPSKTKNKQLVNSLSARRGEHLGIPSFAW